MGTVGAQPTILVVDDDAPIRALAAQVLESRGYQVLLAADSAAALRISDEHPGPIHLLLTDIMMPLGNGIALAQAFTGKRPETPVLYMSGFDAETLETLRNGPMNDGELLQKPFTPRILLEWVQAIVPLGGEQQADPLQESIPLESAADASDQTLERSQSSEAIYRLESPATCPQCRETILTVRAIRLLRTQVNFISTLPRRGRVAVCPNCLAILPVELTNF